MKQHPTSPTVPDATPRTEFKGRFSICIGMTSTSQRGGKYLDVQFQDKQESLVEFKSYAIWGGEGSIDEIERYNGCDLECFEKVTRSPSRCEIRSIFPRFFQGRLKGSTRKLSPLQPLKPFHLRDRCCMVAGGESMV